MCIPSLWYACLLRALKLEANRSITGWPFVGPNVQAEAFICFCDVLPEKYHSCFKLIKGYVPLLEIELWENLTGTASLNTISCENMLPLNILLNLYLHSRLLNRILLSFWQVLFLYSLWMLYWRSGEKKLQGVFLKYC